MEVVVGPPRVQLAKAVVGRSAVKLTVPVGAVADVGVLSMTVAVQLVELPTGTVAGVQLTAVVVSCLRAVTVEVPLEQMGRGAWRERVVIAVGAGLVKKKSNEERGLTAPVMELVLAPPRVQVGKLLLARSAVKLTVPVGAVAEVGVLSVTVAVQLVELPTGSVAGEQLTAVVVSCLRAVTVVVPLEPLWVDPKLTRPDSRHDPTSDAVYGSNQLCHTATVFELALAPSRVQPAN